MSNVTNPNAEEYPLNLLDEIAGGKWKSELPADIGPTLAYVIATLTEREQAIIAYRYKHRLTLEETGQRIGVTRERIRQIEAKAIRKLRHPTRCKFLECGIKGYYLDAAESAALSEINRAANKLSEIADAINAVDGMDSLIKFANDKAQWKREHPQTELTIEELDLSVRSYNVLKRENVKTLGDITMLTDDNLRRLRNLGKKSYQEVRNKVHSYGLNLRGEAANNG